MRSLAWRGHLGVALMALGLGACFNGADAAGLPCTADDQCGNGQTCIDGFCDGPPDEAGPTCGDGEVDEGEECDRGDDNADDAQCKSDCTDQVCGDMAVGPNETCDDGNTLPGDGCDADCVLESCGDGEVDPGEECDDGAANDDNGECTTACKNASCGDGFAQPGEDCDSEAIDAADCDEDCSAVVCGDDHPNAAAGEECDFPNPDAVADTKACMSNCREPLVWEDAETTPVFSTEAFGENLEADLWNQSTIFVANGDRAWNAAVVPEPVDFGGMRLMSPEFSLTGDEEAVTLRFAHREDFAECGEHGDGALVQVSVDGAEWTSIPPKAPYSGTIVNAACSMAEQNPLLDEDAWTEATDDFAVDEVDLTGLSGDIRVAFAVGYDCGDCADVSFEGWFVDDIVVYVGEL